MSTTPVYGFQAALGIDLTTTNKTNFAYRFDFESSTLGVDEDFVDTNGLRGTRDHAFERLVAGIRHVNGVIKMQPTAAELALLLGIMGGSGGWITGGAPSGSGTITYPLGETVPLRNVYIDKVAKVLTYTSVAVDTWTVRGSQGTPLDMELDLVGFDETVDNAGTFNASPTLDVANTPFMFQQLVLTVGGTAYLSSDFTFSLHNAIDRNRFYNSQTLTAAVAMDRHVGLNIMLPAKDAWAVYNLGAALSGGAAITAIFTNANAVLEFNFAKVAFPRKPVTVERGEIMIPLPGVAMKSGSTASVIVTLNPGP